MMIYSKPPISHPILSPGSPVTFKIVTYHLTPDPAPTLSVMPDQVFAEPACP